MAWKIINISERMKKLYRNSNGRIRKLKSLGKENKLYQGRKQTNKIERGRKDPNGC